MENVFNVPETLLAVMEQTKSFKAIIAFSTTHKQARDIICSQKNTKQLFKAQWDNPLFYGPIREWPTKLGGTDISKFDGLQYLCFARHLEKQSESECRIKDKVFDIKTGDLISSSPPSSLDYYHGPIFDKDSWKKITKGMLFDIGDIVLSQEPTAYIGFCKKTKKKVWQIQNPGFVRSIDDQSATMVLANGNQWRGLEKRDMCAVNLKDGSTMWTIDIIHLCPPGKYPRSLRLKDKFIYIQDSQTENTTVVIDIQTGKQVGVLNHHVHQITSRNDYLIMMDNKFVYKYKYKEDNSIFNLVWKTEITTGSKVDYYFSDESILLVTFSAFSDSGVGLIFINKEGNITSQIFVDSAGVGHSEYYHSVSIQIRGKKGIVVQSKGSSAIVCECIGWDGLKKWRYNSAQMRMRKEAVFHCQHTCI